MSTWNFDGQAPPLVYECGFEWVNADIQFEALKAVTKTRRALYKHWPKKLIGGEYGEAESFT